MHVVINVRAETKAFLLCTDFNKTRKIMLAHAQPEKCGRVQS